MAHRPPERSRRLRTVTLAFLLGLAAAACSSSGPSPSPDRSATPSTRPRPVDLCAALDQLQEDIGDFRDLRMVPGNQNLLLLRSGAIDGSYDEVAELTPDGRAALLNTLGDAVTTLGLSVEDYRTTDRLSEAEAYVRRSIDAVARATRSLRQAVGCTVRPRPT